jgi:hypothetical protein
MGLRSRLEAAEARVGRVVNGHEGIKILGGIEADASDKFAWVVGQEFVERLADDTAGTFRERVLTAARTPKERAIFGGLPPMRTDGDA